MVESPGNKVAGIPLLETKLYIPKWRPDLVSRPRLIEPMNQGIKRKLTLVSAPAGFGKTTLLAEWVAAAPASVSSVAWVSLDQGDNDPVFFWAYFITALQKVQPEVGERALSLLHSPQPPPFESILATLINETYAIEDDFALIIDDYHIIDAQPIHSAIDYLLDHLPPQMHLIIASRSDPPLPLARLRGRGELTELRVADLRFTPDEAAAFLNEVMRLDISAPNVEALEKRTEGWIAGLQLAALSMQGREDVPVFVADFSGDDRYIVDYLVEEVLQRQPEPIRKFLLQTSILDRLSGSLCDAVTDKKSSKGTLEVLERSNLFVVPLDDKRQWYRYHHLFADVLHAHLIEEQPDHIPTLHQRASSWYEQNGLSSNAIRHALAAEDYERAANLVELAWPAMRRSSQIATVLSWVKELPDKLIHVRPVLCVVYALALLDDSEPEAAESRLRDAERWLNSEADMLEQPEASASAPEAGVAKMVVADEEQFRSLPALLANARAYHALALGDVSRTVTYARRALDLLQEGDHYERGTTAGLLGLANWTSGNLEEAHRSFAEGLANLQMGGGILQIAIGGAVILAHIRMEQGRLHEAISTYEQSLQLATEQSQPAPPGTADLYLGLSELHRERGNLEAARQHLLRGEELRERTSAPIFEYLWCVTKAQIKEDQGDLDGALDLLHKAERLYFRSAIPDVRPISALKTRVCIAQGRLAEALGWVREQGLTVDDELSYIREYEHITLARVLIAQYTSDQAEGAIHEAVKLLERLLKAAEEGERKGSVIEILLLLALAHRTQGNIPDALDSLERALTLAEPECYFRIFLNEGEPMRDLLRQAVAGGIAGAYTRRLLSAFDDEPTPPVYTPDRVASGTLIDPLTARELEILRLIAAGMRNQEIADQLFISLSTVKRHIANAYGKLEVSHRTEAVSRANELNLL